MDSELLNYDAKLNYINKSDGSVLLQISSGLIKILLLLQNLTIVN